MVLEIRTHPDKGRGWFENPRFWRSSFVDGPFEVFALLKNFEIDHRCILPKNSIPSAKNSLKFERIFFGHFLTKMHIFDINWHLKVVEG